MPDSEQQRVIPFDNLRGLLQDLVGELDRRIFHHIKGTRYENIRPSDLRVGIMASRKPRSVSDIARELEISRQAVHSSVQRLIALEVVELLPDPASGRDKIVAVTEKGWQAQQVTLASIKLLEKECGEILGEKGVEQFRKQLLALVTAMKLRSGG
jgi:DNA-binding MarR family transcriptional regulator